MKQNSNIESEARRLGRLGLLALAMVVILASTSANAGGIEGTPHVFWGNFLTSNLSRADLGGANANSAFVAAAGTPGWVATDSNYIYWTDGASGKVGRANIDGTGANASFITGLGSPQGIAVDGSHIYWADQSLKKICRANLDGTSVTTNFITGLNNPIGIAVDGSHIYWAEPNLNEIFRANLDGSGAAPLPTLATAVKGIAVDANYIYFSEDGPSSTDDAIVRANLDGTGAATIVTGLDTPNGVTVDARYIYWGDWHAHHVGRADLGGQNAHPDFITVADGPGGVAVTRAAPASDANLIDLGVGEGAISPTFVPSTTGYALSVAYGVSHAHVTATANDPVATLTVNGNAATSGASVDVPLSVGTNTITVVVTAENGTTTKTYTTTVTRAAPATNANLASLTVDAGALAPVFAAATTAYTLQVANAVSDIHVTAALSDANASLTVNGNAATSGAPVDVPLSVGANTITVVVTAENATTTKSYTTTVTRAAPATNAKLASLIVDAGTLAPVFAQATTAYTLHVSNAVSTLHLTAATSDANASLTLNGNAATSGAAANVPLSVGVNTATFVVTAQDGTTTKSYVVTVTRAAPDPDASPDPSPAPTPAPSHNPDPAPTVAQQLAPAVTVISNASDNAGRSTRGDALPPVSVPEFTRSPSVQLKVAARPGRTHVVISNSPDFSDARTLRVSNDGTYEWTLLENGPTNGVRTVYVKFVGDGGEDAPIVSTVLLDDQRPVIEKPRYVPEPSPHANDPDRKWLSVPSFDLASGVSYMQFAPDTTHPWRWRMFVANVTVRSRQSFIWVRTADGAGNVSEWQKIALPAKPGLRKR